MARLWGPWTVIAVFTLAGGLIGADIALLPWGSGLSLTVAVVAGLFTGVLTGVFIAWFLRQLDELK